MHIGPKACFFHSSDRSTCVLINLFTNWQTRSLLTIKQWLAGRRLLLGFGSFVKTWQAFNCVVSAAMYFFRGQTASLSEDLMACAGGEITTNIHCWELRGDC